MGTKSDANTPTKPSPAQIWAESSAYFLTLKPLLCLELLAALLNENVTKNGSTVPKGIVAVAIAYLN